MLKMFRVYNVINLGNFLQMTGAALALRERRDDALLSPFYQGRKII